MGKSKQKRTNKWHPELRSAAAVAKAESVAASPAPREWTSAAKPSVSPSSESPSLLSADLHAEVESSASLLTSTKRPALSSAASSRTLSVTPLSTPNTLRERPSLLSTLSTLSSVREELSTVSADEELTDTSPCAVDNSTSLQQ